MVSPRGLVHGFDRPNISLRVDHFHTEEAKRDALTRRVRFADKPGIVYVATRPPHVNIAETVILISRGTPQQPGLVLGLDRGGVCRGVALRLPAPSATSRWIWRAAR